MCAAAQGGAGGGKLQYPADDHVARGAHDFGSVQRVEGTIYTGKKVFTVDLLSDFILEAVPDAGYRLSQVKVQPSGGVSITGNTVAIGSVY